MRFMITGGAGFIGSHTCVQLIKGGYAVVIYDNLRNSDREVLNRIERITGVRPAFVDGDIREQDKLAAALTEYGCEAVIQIAGLKSVADSVSATAMYYDNNVAGTLRLVCAMQQARVGSLVFSSSATVYEVPVTLPLSEGHPRNPLSPYFRTERAVEDMLVDVAMSADPLMVAILRYFNPVGAHEGGLMGEDPQGEPNNLMPFVSQVTVGRRPLLNVFGNDYETPYGTCIRDYVHVMDLAAGRFAAVDALRSTGLMTVNPGTGRGSSVLQLINAFQEVSGRNIAVEIAARRSDDVAQYYASP